MGKNTKPEYYFKFSSPSKVIVPREHLDECREKAAKKAKYTNKKRAIEARIAAITKSM